MGDTFDGYSLVVIVESDEVSVYRLTPPDGGYAQSVDIVFAVDRGLVEEGRSPGFLAAGDRTFRATEAGRAVALAENARQNPPARPSKRRYLHWLRLSDVLPDLSFGEYLRRKLYNDPYYGAP